MPRVATTEKLPIASHSPTRIGRAMRRWLKKMYHKCQRRNAKNLLDDSPKRPLSGWTD
jgi:hypothetical protein